MQHDSEALWPVSFRSYFVGLFLSLILTLATYFLVDRHMLEPIHLVIVINALAIIQAAVQLYYFLHLGQEEPPRRNFLVFSFMVMVLIILVFGSLWIMYNLNYNMVPQIDINAYLKRNQGL